VLVGIGGEVNSLFIVVALLVSRGLGFHCMRAVRQNQRNLYECGSWLVSLKGCCMCFQYPTCKILGCRVAS
jgi:hypothetical protein